jgi:histidinol dehydrogenase
VLVDGAEQATAVVNVIAPEHVELVTADPEALVADVRNAGAIFCGPWAPAVIGDYVAGVNHVLPTARTARFSSALRIDDFCKHTHIVDVDEDALRRVAPYVEALARVEGLTEHGRSVSLRLGRDERSDS